MAGHPHTRGLVAALVLALGVVAAGCVPGADSGRLHQQAQAALTRWADAVTAAGGQPSFVPVGELTRQVGDWELAVGDNNKMALMSGVLETSVSLPTDAPPDGEVHWPDASAETVRLISASQALTDMRADGAQPCPECVPLKITAARLISQTTDTTRGAAEVPVWEFTIEGTAVRVTRVAIANRVKVTPPPWDSSNPPVGISIDSATVAADGRRLTVSFVGGPPPGKASLPSEYSTEAVESSTAVVVILTENFSIGQLLPRSAVGYFRTADVHLAAPLGGRAVLEVKQGLPVKVLLTP